MDEDICGREQLSEACTVRALREVQAGSAFAECDFGDDALVPAWRVNTENVGAEQDEETGGNRSGQDTGQIEHSHPGKWTASRP